MYLVKGLGGIGESIRVQEEVPKSYWSTRFQRLRRRWIKKLVDSQET